MTYITIVVFLNAINNALTPILLPPRQTITATCLGGGSVGIIYSC